MKLISFYSHRVIAFILALFGCVVVVGWAIGNEHLVRIVPGSVAMGLNTAIMFIAAAVCLAIRIYTPHDLIPASF